MALLLNLYSKLPLLPLFLLLYIGNILKSQEKNYGGNYPQDSYLQFDIKIFCLNTVFRSDNPLYLTILVTTLRILLSLAYATGSRLN